AGPRRSRRGPRPERAVADRVRPAGPPRDGARGRPGRVRALGERATRRRVRAPRLLALAPGRARASSDGHVRDREGGLRGPTPLRARALLFGGRTAELRRVAEAADGGD